MPNIILQCKKCNRIFPSGIFMELGSLATFVNNQSQCPYCGSMENIPDGNFKATVEGFIEILEQSENPLRDAKELFEALGRNKDKSSFDNLKKSSQFSQFKKWLPDSPEKLAAYVAIIYTVIQSLIQRPTVSVENLKYDEVFIGQYNQTIINKDIKP